jgi:hypothetical protein
MRVFERWHFGLGWNLRLVTGVIISWRILVYFRGFFEDYIFAWWNIWVFPLFFFWLKILWNVKWQGQSMTKPLFSLDPLCDLFGRAWAGSYFLNSSTSMTCTGACMLSCNQALKLWTTNSILTLKSHAATPMWCDVVWCLLVGMTDFLSSADSVTHIMWQLWDSRLVTGGASCSTFSCVILNYK